MAGITQTTGQTLYDIWKKFEAPGTSFERSLLKEVQDAGLRNRFLGLYKAAVATVIETIMIPFHPIWGIITTVTTLSLGHPLLAAFNLSASLINTARAVYYVIHLILTSIVGLLLPGAMYGALPNYKTETETNEIKIGQQNRVLQQQDTEIKKRSQILNNLETGKALEIALEKPVEKAFAASVTTLKATAEATTNEVKTAKATTEELTKQTEVAKDLLKQLIDTFHIALNDPTQTEVYKTLALKTQNEIADLKNQLSEVSKAKEIQQEKLNEEIKSLTNQINGLQQKLALEEQQNKLTVENLTANLKDAKESSESEKKAKEQLSTQITDLKNEHNTVKQLLEKQIISFQKQVEEVQSAKKSLDEQLKNLSPLVEEVAHLRNTLSQLQTEKQTAEEQVAKLKSESTALLKQADEDKKKINELTAQHSALDKNLKKTLSEKAEFEKGALALAAIAKLIKTEKIMETKEDHFKITEAVTIFKQLKGQQDALKKLNEAKEQEKSHRKYQDEQLDNAQKEITRLQGLLDQMKKAEHPNETK